MTDKVYMNAVVTTAQGGFDKLVYKQVPMPVIEQGEVLIKVLAAGVNNTEINTRIGWYSSSVDSATNEMAEQNSTDANNSDELFDGGWNEQTRFPFIQGTDCCGEVVAVAEQANQHLINQRVLVRPCMRSKGFDSLENYWMGSDFDGAFAEYVKVPVTEVFVVNCDWSDEQLGSIPCAYGTAENMLERALLSEGQSVLITGASGGVGSACVQLAKRRGAHVIAIAGQEKSQQVLNIGADRVLGRQADLLAELGEESVDLVVDNVAGETFANKLKLLKCGGCFVSSGAIAGPIVSLDMRDMYLKDIKLIGCTAWDDVVFPNLIDYIEKGQIKPLVAKVYPLSQVVQAQQAFLLKEHVGKFVLLP